MVVKKVKNMESESLKANLEVDTSVVLIGVRARKLP